MFSQCALAFECDWDHSYVSRLEAGQRQPSRASVLRLVAALSLNESDEAALTVAAGYWPGETGALLALDALTAARAAGLGNKWE